MHKPNAKLKLVLGVLVCAAFITGCGNGNNDSANNSGNNSTDIGANVSALVAYVEGLIAKDGNSDLVDVNTLTLAQDETSEASAISF